MEHFFGSLIFGQSSSSVNITVLAKVHELTKTILHFGEYFHAPSFLTVTQDVEFYTDRHVYAYSKIFSQMF